MILTRVFDRKISSNGFWAFMFGNYIPCPTKDLVQSYLMKDGSYYSSQPGYANKQFVEEFANRDPRMSQTLAYPGWELVNTMTYAPGAGIYVQNLNKNFPVTIRSRALSTTRMKISIWASMFPSCVMPRCC